MMLLFAHPNAAVLVAPRNGRAIGVEKRRRNGRFAKNIRMIAPPPILPSDTAPDMLSFALSGPGLIAGGLFVSICLSYIGMFLEFGPRSNSMDAVSYILRINTDKPLRYDDGRRIVQSGECVLSFPDMYSANVVSNELEQSGRRNGAKLNVWISTMGGQGVKSERMLIPRAVNAEGGKWKQHEVVEGVSDVEKVRFEYDSIDNENNHIDKEWIRYKRDKMTSLRIVNNGEGMCKLCGGSGTRRCPKCGGVTATNVGGTFVCNCENGRVTCEFCGGSGLPL